MRVRPGDCAFVRSGVGRLGTGGASRGLGAGLRPGDGDRNVRSIIEPTLGVLVSSRRRLPSRPGADERDGLRRKALLDCTSDTIVGLIGRARRAAAAAAEERDGVWLFSPRANAEAAAVAALALAVSFVKGCGDRTRNMVSAILNGKQKSTTARAHKIESHGRDLAKCGGHSREL